MAMRLMTAAMCRDKEAAKWPAFSLRSVVAGPAWALAVLVLAAGAAPSAAETRGVVELFTSQGCSSLPPTDKVAGELARDPSLLVMSLPVDYWDYLGWKDTL